MDLVKVQGINPLRTAAIALRVTMQFPYATPTIISLGSFIFARSAYMYYFRSEPFEEMCGSVRRFRDFTEGDMGFAQSPIWFGTLTGKTSALLFGSEKFPQLMIV